MVPELAAPLARTPEEWAEALRPLGVRAFHARQVFRWLHARSVLEPARMTDLPGPVRAVLETLELPRTLEVADERRAADDTRKLLVRMRDGATVETVLIPGVTGPRGRCPRPSARRWRRATTRGDDEPPMEPGAPVRVTQCISTQVGCAMGCVFCASGVAGLKRNLGADEIVAQVLAGRARLDDGERLSNVVYMGMGEPLANYEATARSLRLLTHPDGDRPLGADASPSRPAAWCPRSRAWARTSAAGSASPSRCTRRTTRRARASCPSTRSTRSPCSWRPCAPIRCPRGGASPSSTPSSPARTTTPGEARKLAKLLRGLPVKVNLIPMNPIAASSLGPPDMGGVLALPEGPLRRGLLLLHPPPPGRRRRRRLRAARPARRQAQGPRPARVRGWRFSLAACARSWSFWLTGLTLSIPRAAHAADESHAPPRPEEWLGRSLRHGVRGRRPALQQPLPARHRARLASAVALAHRGLHRPGRRSPHRQIPTFLAHGLVLRASLALEGVQQTVLAPSYMVLHRWSPWRRYGRAGAPIVLTPDTTFGIEGGAGGGLLRARRRRPRGRAGGRRVLRRRDARSGDAGLPGAQRAGGPVALVGGACREPAQRRGRRPSKRARVRARCWRCVFGAAPTVGDIGSCGRQATPLDEATFAAERKAARLPEMHSVRADDADVRRTRAIPTSPATSPGRPRVSRSTHDGVVCIDALEAASCTDVRVLRQRRRPDRRRPSATSAATSPRAASFPWGTSRSRASP